MLKRASYRFSSHPEPPAPGRASRHPRSASGLKRSAGLLLMSMLLMPIGCLAIEAQPQRTLEALLDTV